MEGYEVFEAFPAFIIEADFQAPLLRASRSREKR
jgi:hypothetical protein